MASDKPLFDTLQAEFCPTLDSSLIAALLVDINHDTNGKAVTPTRKQIAELRTTLKELASQAEVLSELSDANLTSSRRDETTSSWTSALSINVDNPNQGTQSRSGQCRSPAGSSSPSSFALKFLQNALPDIPTAKLKDALDAHDGDDLDLWDVIATILSQESIRELEERGFDAFEEEERDATPFLPDLGWETVKRRKPSPETVKRLPTKNKASSKSKSKKLVLCDVRQQHHIQNQQQQRQNSTHRYRSYSSIPRTDPWTQLSTLANQLSTLLPPNPASYFSSHFHSPAYANSYEATQAALMSLCKSDKEEEDATVVLINLLDIVMPENEDLDLDQRVRIISDIDLAVTVTEGRTNDALELTYLLRELDTLGIGVNHLPLPSPPSSPISPNISVNPSGSTVSALAQGKRGTKFQLPSPSIPGPSRVQACEDEWRSVPSFTKQGSRSLTQAYPSDKKNGCRRPYDADHFRLRMRQAKVRRNQALMNAAIMYRKGNRKNRGGDVAMYYAEKAREEQKLIKQESLNAARAMVLARRAIDGNHGTIDVHSTTIAEATAIVKEILDEEEPFISQNKPLKIITGKGKHSVGGVGVLKPAIRDALIADGWIVSSFDAGLTVKARRV